MSISETQSEINRLKKEKDFCVLAHSYQSESVCEIADFVGDSFALAKQAVKAKEKNIMMCGVRFMAETIKILSPEKNVYLVNPTAGCPMAEQLDYDLLQALKAQYPNAIVASYINTTAELKTLSDICVTSSSAVSILKKIPEDEILFIPDINLGTYVAKQIPEKKFHFFHGGCPIHAAVNKTEVIELKKQHPNALVLVHPECQRDVSDLADFVGSTSAIQKFAIESDNKEFIIGTEISIVEHLQFACMGQGKKFYPLSQKLICKNMKMTTLVDVLECLQGTAGEDIQLDGDIIKKARVCIDRMIEMG